VTGQILAVRRRADEHVARAPLADKRGYDRRCNACPRRAVHGHVDGHHVRPMSRHGLCRRFGTGSDHDGGRAFSASRIGERSRERRELQRQTRGRPIGDLADGQDPGH
jgi:hypothetical protein